MATMRILYNCIIKVKHLSTYKGVISWKFVSCFKVFHWLVTTHSVVFVASEGAGETVVAEEE